MPRTRADGSTRPKGEKRDLQAEIAETEDWLQSFAEAGADVLHPDRIGVRRQPEPKSLHTEVTMRVGSIAKPKGKAGKPRLLAPYTLTRQGKGRWQERG